MSNNLINVLVEYNKLSIKEKELFKEVIGLPTAKTQLVDSDWNKIVKNKPIIPDNLIPRVNRNSFHPTQIYDTLGVLD